MNEALAVPMGESLRDFMDYQGLTVAGTSGKELVRQIHNLAAARITLGVWNGEHARQINTQIADAIDFMVWFSVLVAVGWRNAVASEAFGIVRKLSASFRTFPKLSA